MTDEGCVVALQLQISQIVGQKRHTYKTAGDLQGKVLGSWFLHRYLSLVGEDFTSLSSADKVSRLLVLHSQRDERLVPLAGSICARHKDIYYPWKGLLALLREVSTSLASQDSTAGLAIVHVHPCPV